MGAVVRALGPMPASERVPGGLWSGPLDADPSVGRRGRTRLWSYAGAGSDRVQAAAAIVDLGPVSAAFAWAWVDGTLVTWDGKGMPWNGARLGRDATVPSTFRAGAATVDIGTGGAVEVAVPIRGGTLRIDIETTPATPATLVTATAGGGWNATQKAAGEPARVRVSAPGLGTHEDEGGTWRDWTLGAQDRVTTWRWAAGAGRATTGGGRRVGLNLSTGMNEVAEGENLVWWDGVPHAIDLAELAPVGDDPRGDWHLRGEGWALSFATVGVREADENLLLLRSRYVQPVGRFTGTLPDPDGRPVAVDLVGVTEDHHARW